MLGGELSPGEAMGLNLNTTSNLVGLGCKLGPASRETCVQTNSLGQNLLPWIHLPQEDCTFHQTRFPHGGLPPPSD